MPELTELYEKLNELWTKAEERIVAYNLATIVRHEIKHIDGWHTYLIFSKVNGVKGIYLGEIESNEPPDNIFLQPIKECSLVDRLFAAQHFTEFEAKVAEETEAFKLILEKTLREFEEALS